MGIGMSVSKDTQVEVGSAPTRKLLIMARTNLWNPHQRRDAGLRAEPGTNTISSDLS